METFYYFQSKHHAIILSEETLNLTPYTFGRANKTMHESDSIYQFYKDISTDKSLTIVDIGAQSGLYTLYAKFLPLSTFYAFEPFEPTYTLLLDNLKLNNITNVNPHLLGISNEVGKTILNTCTSHNGLHTLGSTPLRFNDIKAVEVNTDTLDNIFYNKDIPVDYIKIDTEGWEYYILMGAMKTIEKYKPYLQIEWNVVNMMQCNVEPLNLAKLITDLGYVQIKVIGEELFLRHHTRV